MSQKDHIIIEKDNQIIVDEKWEKIKKDVWLRDAGFYNGVSVIEKYNGWKNYCRLWKILTEEEKEICTSNFKFNFWLNNNLDVAHIVRRSKSKDLYYDLDNLLLLGRFFHQMLDQYKCPLTGNYITKEDQANWFERIKNGK
jgi:hypothetical protein